MTRKEQREKAAERYANSIAQHDERKTYCVEDFIAGAEWQKEQLEKNRLEHCDNITEEQYNLESDFVTEHIEEYNRMPTFLDAIEYGMKKATDKACEWLLNHNDYQRVLDNGGAVRFDMTQCVMDFRKAMEEQQ